MSDDAQTLVDELRAWLDSIATPPGLRDWGLTAASDDLPAARAWQRMLHDAGWACIGWPREHGGRAASATDEAAFIEELASRGLPRQISVTGPDVAGPIVMRFGTDAQREQLLTPIRTGEHIWCQLWSETEAGSDLANVSTTATRCDGGWRVTGRKVWASAAQIADYALLLARTGPQHPRQAGLTMFALPMDRPGITTSPIVQLDGEAKFNEVFLDAVPVHDDDVLGEVDDGWRLLGASVGRERLTIGAQAAALRRTLLEIVASAGGHDGGLDGVARQRIASAWIDTVVLGLTFRRILTGTGGLSDPRMSVVKLLSTELQQRVASLADVGWGLAVVAGDAPPVTRSVLTSRGATIAGGTSEVQRNIIGERVLGLPREPRA